jgi:hypothetical protein
MSTAHPSGSALVGVVRIGYDELMLTLVAPELERAPPAMAFVPAGHVATP